MKSRWHRSSKQVGIDSDGKGGVSGSQRRIRVEHSGTGGEEENQLSARINRLSYVFIREFISSVHMCRRLNTIEACRKGTRRKLHSGEIQRARRSPVSISIQFMTARQKHWPIGCNVAHVYTRVHVHIIHTWTSSIGRRVSRNCSFLCFQ